MRSLAHSIVPPLPPRTPPLSALAHAVVRRGYRRQRGELEAARAEIRELRSFVAGAQGEMLAQIAALKTELLAAAAAPPAAARREPEE